MAELLRLNGSGGEVRPRYETVPRLRSLEPNLDVYRGLGVPSFRPREGCVFLSGRLLNLRACCLAAVCVQRGYVTRVHARLHEHLLREKDPHAVAAAELYCGAEGEQGLAADKFEALREQYDWWLGVTHALLETAPLGLPPTLVTAVLRHDYGLEDLQENEVLVLLRVLARKVAHELQDFWADGTYDLVTAGLELTDNEGLRRFVKGGDIDNTGRTMLNDLRRQRRRSPVMRLINERTGSARTGGEPVLPQTRVDLAKYRALTLAGRVTRRATSAAVRRQEVLLACEEVLAAVAHDLTAVGCSLLGITDSEVVVEVPERRADRDALGWIAKNAADRVLGTRICQVQIIPTTTW
jgi:hypothetical protein